MLAVNTSGIGYNVKTNSIILNNILITYIKVNNNYENTYKLIINYQHDKKTLNIDTNIYLINPLIYYMRNVANIIHEYTEEYDIENVIDLNKNYIEYIKILKTYTKNKSVFIAYNEDKNLSYDFKKLNNIINNIHNIDDIAKKLYNKILNISCNDKYIEINLSDDIKIYITRSNNNIKDIIVENKHKYITLHHIQEYTTSWDVVIPLIIYAHEYNFYDELEDEINIRMFDIT